METFLKTSCKLMFRFDVYLRNIGVTNYFKLEKSINAVADMVSYTPQFSTKIIKKLQPTLQNGAGCCMYPCVVISSVAL